MSTFSYLPAMDKDSIRKQVEYIVSQGWNPAIEHTEPENAFGHYWYMWKLPMFGETNVELRPVAGGLDGYLPWSDQGLNRQGS